MDARTFLDRFGSDEAEQVANAAGTNLAYFKQIAYLARRPSGPLCLRLEQASGQRLSRYALRPDIYGETPLTESA